MQVILLERIGRLGQMGDIVTVKDGYARNYLLPQGKALRATDNNKARFEKDRAQLEARNLELKKEAEGEAGKLDGQNFVAIRQAGDTGQLYGSVSTRDIADLITATGFSVARNQVQLDKPIKILGIHPLNITLHPEVIVSVNVNVARSEDEAGRQARGEDVTAPAEEAVEDEETIAVEEVFEDEELALQVEEELEAEAVEEEREPADASDAEEPTDKEASKAGEDEAKKD
jgi:large subunit ribosomal protein L9